MEIESSLKTKWQRIKCKINALLGFYRKTIQIGRASCRERV